MKIRTEDEKARRRSERFARQREVLLREFKKDRELLRKIVRDKTGAK